MPDHNLPPEHEFIPQNQTSPLRTWGARGERKPAIFTATAGTWNAQVRVVPIEGLAQGTRFAVIAEWEGPPLPHSGFTENGSNQDEYIVDNDELAMRLAREALDIFRRSEVPDLRRLG